MGGVSVCVPVWRPDGDWRDLTVALAALDAYLEPGDEVVVAWRDRPPDVPAPRRVEVVYVEQAPNARSASCGWNAAVRAAAGPALILSHDDAVIGPDTRRLLLEDVAQLERPGVVAARSDNVRGPQSIRAYPESLEEVDAAVPVFAWVSPEAWDRVGGMAPINWCGDGLLCFDLRRAGWTVWLSRAYVHHLAARTATADAQQAGVWAWLDKHRPDFVAAVREEP